MDKEVARKKLLAEANDDQLWATADDLFRRLPREERRKLLESLQPRRDRKSDRMLLRDILALLGMRELQIRGDRRSEEMREIEGP